MSKVTERDETDGSSEVVEICGRRWNEFVDSGVSLRNQTAAARIYKTYFSFSHLTSKLSSLTLNQKHFSLRP